MTKKETEKLIAQNAMLVLVTAQETKKLIHDRVKHKDIRVKWMLIGRIINSLFSDHYGPVIRQAEDMVKEEPGATKVKKANP